MAARVKSVIPKSTGITSIITAWTEGKSVEFESCTPDDNLKLINEGDDKMAKATEKTAKEVVSAKIATVTKVKVVKEKVTKVLKTKAVVDLVLPTDTNFLVCDKNCNIAYTEFDPVLSADHADSNVSLHILYSATEIFSPNKGWLKTSQKSVEEAESFLTKAMKSVHTDCNISNYKSYIKRANPLMMHGKVTGLSIDNFYVGPSLSAAAKDKILNPFQDLKMLASKVVVAMHA